MKKLKLFAALTLVLSSAALWAQFPGGGGGFGGGRGGYGGGRPGEQGPQRQDTQNINRQFGGEEQESGPKIGTVSGTVIDDKNIPVEYATISIKDNATKKVVTGGISNMKGNFNIKHIPAGKYTVEVSFMGYKTFVSPVFELSQSQKSMNIGKIVLAENADMLDEVVIQGEVTTIENRIDKKIVNVGKDLMTAGASTRDVFENLPMVDVDFDGEVSLQGSSVRVLLDNRPTNMSVTDLIESLPADAIDKIELITNPSAKQDPDGVGGIINIITKKGVLYGLNFNARVGVDSKNRWNGGVNFGYYYGKLAFFANYNFRYSERDNTGETYRANYRPTTLNPNPYLNYQINGGGNSSVSHSLRTGINYLPNKKTSLSYTFGYRPNNSDSDTESSSYFLPLGVPMSEMSKEIAQQIVAEYSESLDDYFNRYRNSVSASKNSTITNSLNFRRDYSNYENLEVDVNYELSDQNSTSTILNTVANSNGRLTTNDFSTNNTNNKMLNVRVDYGKEVRGRSKFEIGAKAELLWRDMPYFYYIDEIPDMSRSNHFKYDQQLYSLYATYSRIFGNFTAQVGLRGEETIYKTQGLGIERNGSEITYVKDNDVIVNRDYFSVYPSLILMYKFGDNNELKATYSRRVSRPNSRDLNPAPRFSDPLYVTVGNPYLDPAFANSVSFQYNRRLGNKGFIWVSGFFRNSTDDIQRVTTRQDPTDPEKPESDVLYTTSMNAGSQYSIGSNAGASYRLFKWWNINGELNYYYRDRNIPGKENYIKSSNEFSARMQNNFNIPKAGTRIRIGMRYSAPRATIQGSSNGMFSADAGVSQEMLKKKLTLSVRVSDIFNTISRRANTIGDDFVMFNNNTMDTRILNFSIAYRFAEMKFKDKRLKNMDEREELIPSDSGN